MKKLSQLLILCLGMFFISNGYASSSTLPNLFIADADADADADAEELKCNGEAKEYEAKIEKNKIVVRDQSPSQEKKAVNAEITRLLSLNPGAAGINASCGTCQFPEQQEGCVLTITGVSVTMRFRGSSGGKSTYEIEEQTITVKVHCSICVSDASGKAVTLREKVEESSISQAKLSNASKLDLSYYPNPVEDNINLSFTVESEDNYNVVFRDIQGKVLLKKELGNLPKGVYKNKLQLENLSNGMYLMSVESSKQVSTVQVVVQ